MRKNAIALVIAAHDEEVVIESTIRSAVKQGQKKKDIYVVADACGDDTMQIAMDILGLSNTVSTTQRSKARSIQFGVDRFGLLDRYDWIHIADADGTFGDDYFKILRKKLNKKYAAATGYIRSRNGSYISAFRVLEYTWGMDVIRRTQSWLKSITVIPGPSSIFRSDVFAQLDWHAPTVAEDFDVTLQIHRQKLGEIQFIPEVKANTQDPYSYKDYVKQISRWNKGTFQSMYRHRIGTKGQMVDAYLSFQVLQGLASVLVFALALPLVAFLTEKPQIFAFAFIYDVLFTALLSIYTYFRTKRKDVLTNFPLVYSLKWIQAFTFLKFFVAIYIFHRYLKDTTWSHKVPRYAPVD